MPADVEPVADRLYALKPDDFAAARDAEVRAARAAADQPLAREIAKLRKPTQSAWLINLLWRDQHEVMEQLFELSQELARAQADADGATLRELTAQRRHLENALMRRAVELGTQAGVRVSDSVAREAHETLNAALAVPDVADAVRSGRLLKPASYAGFGGVTPGAVAPRPTSAPIDLDAVRQRRAAGGAEPRGATSAPPRRADDDSGTRRGEERARGAGEQAADVEQARADEPTADGGQASAEDRQRTAEERQRTAEDRQRAQEERQRAADEQRRQAEEEQRQRLAAERRAAAERQLAQARRDAQRASTTLADATRSAEDAHDRASDLRQQVETLRRQLARVESEAERADEAASEADVHCQQADAANAQAMSAVSVAQTELSDLAGG